MKASPIGLDHLSRLAKDNEYYRKQPSMRRLLDTRVNKLLGKRGQKSNFLHFVLHDWRLIQSQTVSPVGFPGPHAKLIGQSVFLADL